MPVEKNRESRVNPAGSLKKKPELTLTWHVGGSMSLEKHFIANPVLLGFSCSALGHFNRNAGNSKDTKIGPLQAMNQGNGYN